MICKIKVNNKIKLKCYRGDEFIEPRSGMATVIIDDPGVPGYFTLPADSIAEVIREKG
jgi:hypothetical protein